jgi:type II secretory pathway component PulF
MKAPSSIHAWQREYFSRSYKIAFLNAMELRLQAGESAGRALRAVILAEGNPAKQRDMAPALSALEQGELVSVAIGQLGFFDSTVLAILKAGERSGMRNAISSAAAHLSVRQAWLRQHALVLFILANEMLSAVLAPVLLYTAILPWIRQHISEPTEPAALLQYQHDMAIAQSLTLGLIGLTVLLLVVGVVNVYRIRRLAGASGVLLFFADSAMAVGFKLAAAMLKAGVTIEAVARDLSTQAPGWSRQFWASVNVQLQLAVEPAQALLQPGIYVEERALLASHANARQLADTCQVLAGGREHRARRGRDLLLVLATAVTLAYIFMTLGVAVWVYLTYDSTLSAGLDALGREF